MCSGIPPTVAAADRLREPTFAVRLDDGGEERLVGRLEDLESRVAALVQHPDVLTAPDLLAPLGRRLALENMDARKPGRDVAELEPYFRVLPEAGLCVDVAHVNAIAHL